MKMRMMERWREESCWRMMDRGELEGRRTMERKKWREIGCKKMRFFEKKGSGIKNRLNIPKTIRKFSIDHNFRPMGMEFHPGPLQIVNKHGDDDYGEHDEDYVSLKTNNFDGYSHQFPIFVVNFYAPWCYWSNRLKPSWEKTAKIMKERYDPEIDGRILLAKVDCTVEIELCRRFSIFGALQHDYLFMPTCSLTLWLVEDGYNEIAAHMLSNFNAAVLLLNPDRQLQNSGLGRNNEEGIPKWRRRCSPREEVAVLSRDSSSNALQGHGWRSTIGTPTTDREERLAEAARETEGGLAEAASRAEAARRREEGDGRRRAS
ncbi:hypothetical protein Sjap_013799 [Stephania japonica]|uniref:protein disulfide-isomerase n=1 Tax=Stephania japonica TaxID=461633 RepID=A0AAP0IYG8_9MAGN